MKAVARNINLSVNSAAIMLSNDKSIIMTEELTSYFVQRGQNFVNLVFLHHEDVLVTSKILRAAVTYRPLRRTDEAVMKPILSKAETDHVDETFLVEVAARHSYEHNLMAIVIEAHPAIKITTPVLEAAITNELALRLLLALPNSSDNSTDLVYLAATTSCSYETLKILLEREPHAEITEEMLEMAASRNDSSNIRLLFRQARAFPVTMRMLKLAALNVAADEDAIDLLLAYMTKLERSKDVIITTPIGQARAGSNSGTMSRLVRCLGSRSITESVVQAVIEAGTATPKLLNLLFSQTKMLEVSSDMLLLAARGSGNTLALLLQRAGGKIYITEDMIKMSVCNQQNLQILISQPQRATTSEATLEAVAARGELSTLMIVLGTCKMEINKGKLVVAAASNVHYGAEVLQWLLSSGQVDIPEEAFLSAAKNRGSPLLGFYIFKLLLRRSMIVQIKENLMMEAASNDCSGRDIMQLLLSQPTEPTITTEVLIAAAANPLPESMFSILEVLLEHLRDHSLVTEDVLASAAGYANCGKEGLQLLFARTNNAVVNEKMLKAAAVSEPPVGYKKIVIDRFYWCRFEYDAWPIQHVMEFLMEQPTAKITEEVVRLAAANKISGRPLMRLLLSHPKNGVSVSPSITSMAASNSEYGDIIMKILIEKKLEEIDITSEVVLAAEQNEKRGKAILQRLLGLAAEKGDREAERMLLKSIRTEPQGIRDALFQVVYRGQMRAMTILLDDGADLHEETEGIGNVLHVAAYRGQEDIVRFLIAQGMDVNAPGGPHGNALCASLYGSHPEITKILVEAGASHESPDSMGRTALHRATRARRFLMVEGLLQLGADVNGLDRQKCSALHHAAATGSLDVTKLLIASGISVLQSDSFGWTPLHWAARAKEGNFEIVEALLTAGASRKAIDSMGMSPFAVAVFCHNGHLRSVLCVAEDIPEP
ncbi:hypothetical protein MMC18_003611 [Xylographa bjoerkii]|nr:hypothetical protein [Xylographa bjoerkii]